MALILFSILNQKLYCMATHKNDFSDNDKSPQPVQEKEGVKVKSWSSRANKVKSKPATKMNKYSQPTTGSSMRKSKSSSSTMARGGRSN
jgi:hypothetical protein